MLGTSRSPGSAGVTEQSAGEPGEPEARRHPAGRRAAPEDGLPELLAISLTLVEPIDAERVERCLEQAVEAVSSRRTLATGVNGRLFEFSGPDAQAAPSVSGQNGPLLAAALRGSASAGCLTLSIEAHPGVCNELGLAAIVNHALTIYDGAGAGVHSLSAPCDDSLSEQPVDRLPALPVFVPAIPDGERSRAGDLSIPLADGTIEALSHLASRHDVHPGVLLRNVWALYISVLNANEAFDLLYSPFDDASRFRPHLLAVQTISCDPDDSLDSLLRANAQSQPPVHASLGDPGPVVVMTLQPACLDFRRASQSVGGIRVRSLPSGSDLHVVMTGSSSGEQISATFMPHVVDAGFVRHRLQEFATVIAAILNDSSVTSAGIDCLPADERRVILEQCSGETIAIPPFASSAEAFAASAAESPDASALRFDEHVMTYAELAGEVGACRRWLEDEGIEPGQRVAVMLPQSPDYVIVTLALLNAGCTWVPLDRKLPLQRLAYVCEDSDAKAIVTNEPLEAGEAGLPRRLFYVSGGRHERAADVVTEAPAYILYTSGSTGKPKGVVISRRAMLCHNAAIANDFKLSRTDRVLQFANPVFDVSIEEIFPTLTSGATVVFLPDRERLSIAEFHRLVVDQALTVLNLPAGFWHEWVRYLAANGLALPDSLRLVIAGSDRVSPEVFETWRRMAGSRVAFRNGYGPTETTITATLFDPDRQRAAAGTVPIGRPVANMLARVVRDGRVMPYGARGELLLGGPQLAAGYVGRADLDGEVFINRSIDGEPRRWYRTGDEVRLLPDGNLEFLGRIDHQVKLNGFRIELGEIERVLESVPEVTAAAAAVKRNAAGNASLVAWYTTASGNEVSTKALSAVVAGALPMYMQPARYQWLDRMPMTPGGKVNRRALPEVELKRPDLVNPLVRPGNSVETGIARAWSEELGIADIGVLDNFFELGGSSMSGLRIIEAINRLFSISISAAQFFQYPTVASLARYIGGLRDESPVPESGPTRGTRQRDAYSRLKARRRGQAG